MAKCDHGNVRLVGTFDTQDVAILLKVARVDLWFRTGMAQIVLDQTRIRQTIKGQRPCSMSLNSCVQQASILGPMPFVLYTGHLDNIPENISLLYAEDFQLIPHSREMVLTPLLTLCRA